MSGKQGFENERRWLQHLIPAQKAAQNPKLFALVGFDRAESEYLIELAKERLKTAGIDLSMQAQVMNEAALAELKCYQYSLFDASPFLLYEMSGLSLSGQKQWVETLSASGISAMLVVTSGKFESCWSLILSDSNILDVSEEKPWHRQDRLSEWFRAFLKHKGLDISAAFAIEVVQAYNLDRRALKTQAQAWADEKGYQGSISTLDLQMNPSYTVWKLLDDLWQAKTGHALLKLASLLKDEPSGISLSALLRQQWATIGGYFENAQAAHKKNLEAVAKRLGKERWKQGLIKIHQAQIDLRSSKPPQAVLERLLIGLMQLQQ
jgi:hypothetical protein